MEPDKERDATLATIEDITEDETNITLPLNLPSTTSISTSSSSYSAISGRLLKYRSRAYRKRLSRSIEQISASSHSAQTSDKEESDDDDSLASCNVFGSQDDQIKFLKDTLLQCHKELENYKILNADLTKKLERCKKHRREVEKMLENCLWEKLKLYNKYRKLQRRFDVPETPPGGWEDSSPSDSSGAPGNGARLGTPIRRPRKRANSGADRRDGAGPSKRPTTVRCGLDHEVMESASNVSSADELSDSGFSMADHSAKSCYESDTDASSSRSDSQCSLQSALVDQDISRNPDRSNDAQSENDVPSHVSPSECSLQSALVDQDVSNNPDGSNDAQSENDVPSHVSPSEADDADNRPVCTLDANENSMEAIRMDGNEEEEEEDAGSASDRLNQTGLRKRRSSDSQEEEHPVDGPDYSTDAADSSFQSSKSSSGSRKRPRSSASVSSEGESGGSKRRKSSSPSSGSSGSTHSDTSDSPSDSSSLPACRSPSRSSSPPPAFRDAPRVIPPFPLGTQRLPRFWQRNGNDVR